MPCLRISTRTVSGGSVMPEAPSREGFPNYGEDVYWPFPHARLMVALMAWHEFDNNPKWLKVGRHLAEGLQKVAQQNERDVPGLPTISRPSWLVRQWRRNTKIWLPCSVGKKPTGKGGSSGGRGAGQNQFSGHRQSLARTISSWAGVSGDEEALELARKTARFMLKPTM